VFHREAAEISEEAAIRRVIVSLASSTNETLDLSLKDLFAGGAGARAARLA
jgi:hypothetical protein